MNIGILGANSQIAKDLICSFEALSHHQLILFSRRKKEVNDWLKKTGSAYGYVVKGYDDFNVEQKLDVIINFIGVGDPLQAALMGASILDITYQYDAMALKYLEDNPTCRYLFISSGAAYGSNFQAPVDENTRATFQINNLEPTDWYGIAKFYAESRHRALNNRAIVDIRIFNYFSHRLNMDSRFLIADIVRAILDKTVLQTSAENFVRDYLNSVDLHQLIVKILDHHPTNLAVDCYTLEPIDKFSLLVAMHEKFGLNYEIDSQFSSIHATGMKHSYYSKYRAAEQLGYRPTLTSLQGVCKEVKLFLEQRDMVLKK